MKKNIKLLISGIFFIVFITIFNIKVNAASYTTRYESNNSATFFENQSGYNNSNTAVGISALNNGTAKYIYSYTGLSPKEFYSITAYVKVNSITCKDDDYQSGALIALNETPASSEIIKSNTNGWKKLNYVALSSEDGTLNIQASINNAFGNVLFDNIELKKITNDSNYVVYTYTNEKQKTARLVVPLEKVYGKPITKSEIDNWLKVILQLREYMTEFTGIEVDSGNVDIIGTNYYGAYAFVLSGRTEIQWMQNCVDMDKLHNYFSQGADTAFFITHEMGHQHSMYKEYDFETEYWGSFIGFITSYNLGLKVAGLGDNIMQTEGIVDFCYDRYVENFIEQNRMYGDGLIYLTFKTIFELNQIQTNLGWNSLKQTLKFFKDSSKIGTSGEAYIKFIKKWEEFSGKEIRNMFYKYNTNDKNIIEDYFKFGKFTYTLNDDDNTITVNDYTRNFDEFNNNFIELEIPSYIDGHKVTKTGNWSFANRDYINKVKLPETLEIIRGCTLYNCTNLESVEIPKNSNLKVIEDWCLFGNKMQEIYIPRSVIEIREHSLYGDNTIIRGYSGTEAQRYANEKNFTFEEYIDVASVVLDKTNITLNKEETDIINATVNPQNATNKNIIWTSDNENVAIVNNGVVTAKGVGTTIIRAKTEDEGKVATCTVNVTESDTIKPEVTINKIIDKELYEICITATDNSGIKSVEYKLDNNDNYAVLLSRNDGKYYILPKCNGTYTIKVTDNKDNVKTETIVIDDVIEQAYITKAVDNNNEYIVKITTRSNNQVKDVKINNTKISKQESGEYVFKPNTNGEYIIEVEYEDNSSDRTVYNETRLRNEEDNNENNNTEENEQNNTNNEEYGNENENTENQDLDEHEEDDNKDNPKENEEDTQGETDESDSLNENQDKSDDEKNEDDKIDDSKNEENKDDKIDDSKNEENKDDENDEIYGSKNKNENKDENNNEKTKETYINKSSEDNSKANNILPKTGIIILPVLPLLIALILYAIVQIINKKQN